MHRTHINGFFLLGISVRTTNQNGQAEKDIDELWCRFMDDNILLQIVDRLSDEVYCVYTDYETDHNGFYTVVLGCRVNSLDNIPVGLISLIVAPGTYSRYTAKSWVSGRVAQTWQHIWSSNLNRKFTTDFDVYGIKTQNPEDSRVEIYVGVE
jgi:predicted transcriptional regulator YdeE